MIKCAVCLCVVMVLAVEGLPRKKRSFDFGNFNIPNLNSLLNKAKSLSKQAQDLTKKSLEDAKILEEAKKLQDALKSVTSTPNSTLVQSQTIPDIGNLGNVNNLLKEAGSLDTNKLVNQFNGNTNQDSGSTKNNMAVMCVIITTTLAKLLK